MKLRKAGALLGLVIGFDVAFVLSIIGYVGLASFLASAFTSTSAPDLDQMKRTTRLAMLAVPVLCLALCVGGAGIGYSLGSKAEERDPGAQNAKASRMQWWFSMIGGISLAVLLAFVALLSVLFFIGRHLVNAVRG